MTATDGDVNAALRRLQGEVDRLTKERDEAQRLAGTMSGLRDAGERDYDALKLVLAASQAEAAALREALTGLTRCVGYAQEKSRYGPLFGAKCIPTIAAADAALSLAPGGREALREMLTKCALAVMDDDRVDYRGDDDAAPVCVAAAIVARLVPDAGQEGAEG